MTHPSSFPQPQQRQSGALAFSIPGLETHSHSLPLSWGVCSTSLTVASSDCFLWNEHPAPYSYPWAPQLSSPTGLRLYLLGYRPRSRGSLVSSCWLGLLAPGVRTIGEWPGFWPGHARDLPPLDCCQWGFTRAGGKSLPPPCCQSKSAQLCCACYFPYCGASIFFVHFPC